MHVLEGRRHRDLLGGVEFHAVCASVRVQQVFTSSRASLTIGTSINSVRHFGNIRSILWRQRLNWKVPKQDDVQSDRWMTFCDWSGTSRDYPQSCSFEREARFFATTFVGITKPPRCQSVESLRGAIEIPICYSKINALFMKIWRGWSRPSLNEWLKNREM